MSTVWHARPGGAAIPHRGVRPGRLAQYCHAPASTAHPHLIILRTVATVAISCIVGQAGWAAAFLGGSGDYLPHHRVGAVVTAVVSVLGALVYLVLRRSAGPVNVGLAVGLAVAVGAQYALGETDLTSLHIFWVC